MKKVILLGAGRIGKAIAFNLHTDFAVTAVDLNEDNLYDLGSRYKIDTCKEDITDIAKVKKLIRDYDLVIGAVPGFMGYEMAKTVIESGKNLVDISFFDEDPFSLDKLARSKNVIAVTDVGVAPGLDNIILGYHNEKMEVQSFACYVGGLPVHPQPPFFYKAPFSPIDVLEEYTRPSRILENGKLVVKEALSEIETMEFPGVGKLEAFNTDGLRSLVTTMKHIPNMKEKTLRYPKHVEYMKVFRSTGLFGKEEITVKGKQIRPIDFTSALMFPLWKIEKNEPELTVMQVVVEGIEKGRKTKYIYDLLDYYDASSDMTSMARTTGYTCAAAARMVINGLYAEKGISPPEYVCRKESNFDFLLQHLAERGIDLKVTKELS